MKKAAEVHFLTFSGGGLGGPKLQRIKESRESAKLIGAQIKILDYPDGAIPVNAEIIAELKTYIREIAPDIIFTPYPDDTHQDHRNVSKITISACRGVNKILFYEIPSTEVIFKPNLFYDVTDCLPIKEKALNCHKTQREKQYHNLTEVRGLAIYRAYQCHCHGRLFEAFHIYRWIET